MRLPASVALLPLGLMLAIGLQSCAFTPEDSPSDRWPLYRESVDARSGERRVSALGPIYDERQRPDGSTQSRTVAPLYNFVSDPARYDVEHVALYPLARYRRQERGYGPEPQGARKIQYWLGPGYYNYFSAMPGEWESDFALFAPLYGSLSPASFPMLLVALGGESSKGEEYFAVVPVGGTLRGLLTTDEIRFLGGPAYVEVRMGENRIWYFPFPFLRYGTGPGYSSIGVLPLFSHASQQDRFSRTSLLWPVFSWGVANLDSVHPVHHWSAFPLAGRIWTDQSEMVSVLWPFFNYGSNAETGARIIDAPWPIFRLAQGPTYEEIRIWPLYSRSRQGKDWITSVAWPFVWNFERHTPNFEQNTFMVLPVLSVRNRSYLPEADGTVRSEAETTIWPLAHYQRDLEHRKTFRFPYLLPYFGPGFERSYREILTLAKYEEDPDGSRLELLWGVGSWQDDRFASSCALHPLFQYQAQQADTREAGGSSAFNLVYGLLGWGKDEGKAYIRLLWALKIPV